MKLKHEELDWGSQQVLFQITFDKMGSVKDVLATSKHDVSYVKELQAEMLEVQQTYA